MTNYYEGKIFRTDDGKFYTNDLDGQGFSEVAPPVAAEAPYKIYTAIMNQSGSGGTIFTGPLSVGVRYTILLYAEGDDFLNVGASANEQGITFIATGTTPTNFANESTLQIESAPIATVLENTIGEIVWSRADAGQYNGTLVGAFPQGKTMFLIAPIAAITDGAPSFAITRTNDDTVFLVSVASSTHEDNWMSDLPIEIRVYP